MQDYRKLESLLEAKLKHYNAWLLNPKRGFTDAYPGFPQQRELDILSGLTPPAPIKASRASKPKAQAPKASVRKGSKLEMARVLFERMVDRSRASVVEAFMSELSMTKAGATTYFYTVNR